MGFPKQKQQAKPPSVLFINRIRRAEDGASGRVLSDLTGYLARKGWAVHVLSLTPDRKTKTFKNNGIIYHFIRHKGGCRSISDLASALMKIFVKGHFLPKTDIVISMTDPPMLVCVAGRIAVHMQAKHIHWLHDLYPDLMPALIEKSKPGLFYRGIKTVSRKAMKAADRLIVIGRCMNSHLKHTGLDPRGMLVVPNWANLSLFQKAHSKQGKADKFRILYAGNIGKAHEMKPVLQSMSTLQTSNPEIEFIFVGKTPGHVWLKQQCSRKRLGNARFLNWQPEAKLKKLMEMADLHLITMKKKALGMLVPCKFYSAVASLRPVIFLGPKESEIGLVIRDYGCGTIIDPEAGAKKLTDAILTYRNDGDAWFAAQKGIKEARELYNPKNSLKAWDLLLDTVIKE